MLVLRALSLASIALLLAACGPGATVLPTMLAPTAAASPTATQARTGPATTTPGPTATAAHSEVPEGGIAVYFGDVRFAAMVADTPAKRTQGLSGHPGLADDEGMWFDFGQPVQARFWMKDMLFSLDMIWIDEDLQVVAVSHDVPAPAPGTPDSQLPTYDSGGIPVQYVLEINAGLADRHGIGPGTPVRTAEE